MLKDSGVAISMDGRGRCLDNIFIERLWRSLKYEAVYLHERSDGFGAQRLIARWFDSYDRRRPHSALGGSTQPRPTKRNAVGQAGPAPRLACLSAGSTGRAGCVKQDPGGMIDHPEYTLFSPPICPTKWDHLTRISLPLFTLPTKRANELTTHEHAAHFLVTRTIKLSLNAVTGL